MKPVRQDGSRQFVALVPSELCWWYRGILVKDEANPPGWLTSVYDARAERALFVFLRSWSASRGARGANAAPLDSGARRAWTQERRALKA